MKLSKLMTAIVCGILFTTACKKAATNDQENINDVTINIGASNFRWVDADGTGGAAPKIDTIKLLPGFNSTFTVNLSDASQTPSKSFNGEVDAEKDVHLFVFKTTGGNLTITDLSKDNNLKDFGRTAKLTTTTAGAGTLQIILKHMPDKQAANPSTTGETDVDVTFPVVIKN